MRRRSHRAATLVAILAVGWSVVTTEPRGWALAADPNADLAETQQQLADAYATQQSLRRTLEQQRSQLAQLRQRSTDLSTALDVAKAELASITAEHDRVAGLLAEVRLQVEEIVARLAALRADIRELDAELTGIAIEIRDRSAELARREALLEEHLRSAYVQSQTSLLEVILSADSFDEATTQVGYLLTISDQDVALAEEIRGIRVELETRRATLKDGRRALAEARATARAEETVLKARQEELAALEGQLAELQVAAEQKQAEQEGALNLALEAQGNVEAQIAANQQAAQAATELAARLRVQAAAQQAAIEEARRRAAEEARRNAISPSGFRWPQAHFEVTQEWGPTAFVLEPGYSYGGTYYPHFHGGIDISSGCGTPVMASAAGVVVASGQPLAPFDSGYGVIVDQGGGIQTWYWHLQARVVAIPGQIVIGGDVIGFEGNTGNSTGCHLHFAVNDGGIWENPRRYLP